MKVGDLVYHVWLKSLGVIIQTFETEKRARIFWFPEIGMDGETIDSYMTEQHQDYLRLTE